VDRKEDVLLVKARGGDRQALAALAARYGSELYRLARYILRSDEEARDAVADVFARLCTKPQNIPLGGFRTWAVKVTCNHCRDLLRRKGTLTRLLPVIYNRSAERANPTPEQAALAADEQASVRQAVARLPEQERIIVVLRYYHQLSYAEISAVLGIPQATVGTRLHRARERLRQLLGYGRGGREPDALPE
jgi:RNA polymerase sigma-70 factor (ECF subfamily)